MKAIKKIDTINNIITFEDDSKKYVDSYILELREKLESLEEKINNYLYYDDRYDLIDYLKDFLLQII